MIRKICHSIIVLITLMWIEPSFASTSDIISIYSSITPNNKTIVRAISKAETCPIVLIDGSSIRMGKRVGPIDGTLTVNKPAVFPESVCELLIPDSTQSISIEGQVLPKRNLTPQKIVLLGDTGCRMKSPSEFQSCENESLWPLAKVASSAAAEKPDLVVHVGDYHYRENKCKTAGCEHSPFGYGFDTWNADFFSPLQPLLKVAPWVFVRGNHESCARAGQGWFRYLDPREFKPESSCATKDSSESEFTEPYSIVLGENHRLIVFDSSGASEKNSPENESSIKKFQWQFKKVAELTKGTTNNWLILHHPVLGYGFSPTEGFFKGNATLIQSLQRNQYQDFFPDNIQLTIQGHLHTFELTSFENSAPLSLITGFGGSLLEPNFIGSPPSDFEIADAIKIAQTRFSQSFGYTTLEKNSNRWTLKQKDVDGQTKLTCDLELDTSPKKIICKP